MDETRSGLVIDLPPALTDVLQALDVVQYAAHDARRGVLILAGASRFEESTNRFIIVSVRPPERPIVRMMPGSEYGIYENCDGNIFLLDRCPAPQGTNARPAARLLWLDAASLRTMTVLQFNADDASRKTGMLTARHVFLQIQQPGLILLAKIERFKNGHSGFSLVLFRYRVNDLTGDGVIDHITDASWPLACKSFAEVSVARYDPGYATLWTDNGSNVVAYRALLPQAIRQHIPHAKPDAGRTASLDEDAATPCELLCDVPSNARSYNRQDAYIVQHRGRVCRLEVQRDIADLSLWTMHACGGEEPAVTDETDAHGVLWKQYYAQCERTASRWERWWLDSLGMMVVRGTLPEYENYIFDNSTVSPSSSHPVMISRHRWRIVPMPGSKWSPALHAWTPRAFLEETRAMLSLNLRALDAPDDAPADKGTGAPADKGTGAPAWGAMPVEVLEMAIDALWQRHVRAGSNSAQTQAGSGLEFREEFGSVIDDLSDAGSSDNDFVRAARTQRFQYANLDRGVMLPRAAERNEEVEFRKGDDSRRPKPYVVNAVLALTMCVVFYVMCMIGALSPAAEPEHGIAYSDL